MRRETLLELNVFPVSHDEFSEHKKSSRRTSRKFWDWSSWDRCNGVVRIVCMVMH